MLLLATSVPLYFNIEIKVLAGHFGYDFPMYRNMLREMECKVDGSFWMMMMMGVVNMMFRAIICLVSIVKIASGWCHDDETFADCQGVVDEELNGTIRELFHRREVPCGI